jgi:endonuclease/exonuclease/phosphatase family metal-dependent hydrolase
MAKAGFSPHDERERARFAVYALNRRAAEAATVRAAVTALLDDEDQERPVVVLGDLNDEIEAATTQILQGPPGSEIGTGGYDQPDTGDGPRLWNLAARIPEGQRFSRRYRGRGELIDHILVSHALIRRVAQDAVTTDAAGPVRSVTDDPAERRDAAGSDHRPVMAQIDI